MFYSMGEVSEMLDVNPSLLRFWEKRFSIIKPHKNKKGNRMFTPSDVENLKLIYHLVKEKGMTLDGAEKALKKGGSERRDNEMMERLLTVRSLLEEIRQELGPGEGIVIPPSMPEKPLQPEPREETPVAQEIPAPADVSAAVPAPQPEPIVTPQPEPDPVPAAAQQPEPVPSSAAAPKPAAEKTAPPSREPTLFGAPSPAPAPVAEPEEKPFFVQQSLF